MNSEIFNLILSGNHEVVLDNFDRSMDKTEKLLCEILIGFTEGKFQNVIGICEILIPHKSDLLKRNISRIFKIRASIFIEPKEEQLHLLNELELELLNSMKGKSQKICLYYLYISLIEYCIHQSILNDLDEYLLKIEKIISQLDNQFKDHFLVIKGQLSSSKGQFDEALSILNKCLGIFMKIENPYIVSKIYNIIGSIYGKKGNYRKAKKIFYELINISSSISNDYELALSFNRLSIIANFQGNHQEAYNYFSYSLDLANKNGYHRLKNDLIINRAGIMYREGKYLEAIEDYTELLNYYSKIYDTSKIQYLLACIGASYSRLGIPDVALDYYEQIFEIGEQKTPDTKTIQLLINVADLYIQTGRYSEAKKRVSQANVLNKKFGSKQFDAHIFLTYGKLNFQCGNYKEALDELTASSDLFYAIENVMMYYSAKYHLSKVYHRLGNYKKSIRNLKECEDLSSASGNLDQKSRILLLLLVIYIEIYRFDKAKEIVKRLQEMKPQMPNNLVLKRITLAETLVNQYLEGNEYKSEIKYTYTTILSEKQLDREFYPIILIHFIEFLLSEVYINDDDELIEDIEKYLFQLFEHMTQLSSPYLRCLTQILQYKIAIAKGDLFFADLYLNEAHEVATAYGFSGKINEISLENLKLTQLIGAK